jgi:1-acyl-sn-glycerol-3-phosphate acyltransferase
MKIRLPVAPDVRARLERLELPFSRTGVDPFGVSRAHLGSLFSVLRFLYKSYFTVKAFGTDHIPKRGRAMLVGNHSGGVAIDGAMVLASMFFELDPPRLAHGMAEKFIASLPFAGEWAARCGQFTGLPQHATRLLEAERLLMVFPEGARGTAKLYPERNSLVGFGTGFMRLALETKTPIIPFAFLGGGEAIPTVMNAYRLGRLFGVPYIPVTPYLFALPLPVSLEVYYGAPRLFEGTGREEDSVIGGYVDEVKRDIATMIEAGQRRRDGSGPRSLTAGSRGVR